MILKSSLQKFRSALSGFQSVLDRVTETNYFPIKIDQDAFHETEFRNLDANINWTLYFILYMYIIFIHST